jgi:hypothetical protein
MRKIIDAFTGQDDAGTLTWCRHLKPGAPAPAAWQPWHPGRLYCMPCLLALPRLTSKEDRRCDACRTIVSSIHPARFLVPARQMPARPGKPPGARPPVVIMYGLCGRCLARHKAITAELMATASSRFRFPPAGRHVSPREASSFRTALTAARALADDDKDAMVQHLVGDGDPLRVLWAAVHLTIILLHTVIDQAEWVKDCTPPTPEDILATIPVTFQRWESYGPGAGLTFPGWREQCTAAVDLITTVMRDGDGILTSLTSLDSIAQALAGCLYVFSATLQIPVHFALAPSMDHVWTEMDAAISRWEAAT